MSKKVCQMLVQGHKHTHTHPKINKNMIIYDILNIFILSSLSSISRWGFFIQTEKKTEVEDKLLHKYNIYKAQQKKKELNGNKEQQQDGWKTLQTMYNNYKLPSFNKIATK